MSTKRYILTAVAAPAIFFAGYFFDKGRTDKPTGTTSETRETHYDTIPFVAPKLMSELVSDTMRYMLPTYRFIGGWPAGGEQRQHNEDDVKIIEADTASHIMYGTGAGGEPRCSGDSVIVELPKMQRHYADSTYEAWVSGPLDPRLDSIKVLIPTTIITKREWKPPKRWHIGVSAGYGYGPGGFQPYVGIGVTYSLISF